MPPTINGMAKNGRFLPGSFSAHERTDCYRVCLARIGAMSVYKGWVSDCRVLPVICDEQT